MWFAQTAFVLIRQDLARVTCSGKVFFGWPSKTGANSVNLDGMIWSKRLWLCQSEFGADQTRIGLIKQDLVWPGSIIGIGIDLVRQSLAWWNRIWTDQTVCGREKQGLVWSRFGITKHDQVGFSLGGTCRIRCFRAYQNPFGDIRLQFDRRYK